MKRTKKITNWTFVSPIDAYYMLRSGEIKRFPDNFIDKPACKEIVRHVLLDKLNLTRKDICEKSSYPFLRQYHLSNFRKLFHDNIYKLISYCFPEMNIKGWELKRVSNDFWKDKQNIKEYLLWIIEKNNLDINKAKDMRKITAQFVIKNNGKRALTAAGGIFPLLTIVTGTRYKEWEIIKTCKWDNQKSIAALKWLFEEKLKWSKEEIANNLCAQTFIQNNLGGLFKNYLNNNQERALNLVYPNTFKKKGNKFIVLQ